MTLKRSTPIKRTSGKKRRVAAVCSVLRCKRRPSVRGLCMTHARVKADTEFAKFIREREDRCRNCGSVEQPQCAHIISRGARYIRWDPDNAVRLCAPCHQSFTLKPAAWAVWLEQNLPGRYLDLVHREMAGERSGTSESHMERWLEAAA